MDLFEYMSEMELKAKAPLAVRMRPKNLEEMVGQEEILSKGKLLYRLIKSDKLSSIILWGPPGTGKTTISSVIASTTNSIFKSINAVSASKKDMEEAVKEASAAIATGKRTILFIDEIHRFNKGQQDYLLPYVENGTIILIGATTENPYFEVNSALISRAVVFELKPLSAENIISILKNALQDKERGLGSFDVDIDDDALNFASDIAGGDARTALNTLELSVLTTPPQKNGKIKITAEIIKDCSQQKKVLYDKDGDNHYDIISAFIKSMRGSDPDAAIYYLARMLAGGEDIKFIARRIMICASEDVGNADPNALSIAVSTALAVERLGMPEARIPLAQAAVYVACAPKSNASYLAIDRALDYVKKNKAGDVPSYLKDAHYKGAEALGHGIGYKYPHNYPGHVVKQRYLPEGVEEKFYRPDGQGKEIKA